MLDFGTIAEVWGHRAIQESTMCGLIGQYAASGVDKEGVRRGLEALAHRGPDGDGFFARDRVALGHCRLAIIDLEGGQQPMSNEHRTLTVVFNGEIYNYRELQEDLRRRHRLATSSDTEVLLHLYEDLGERMVERLRGMFAFAIWDSAKQQLFAARDRFGEKPFLYAEVQKASGPVFTFASEMGALRAAGVDVGEIDRAALSDYLELLYIPAPRTIFRNVRKLPAGHFLIANERGVAVRRYWTPPVPGSAPASVADLSTSIRKCLEESVRLRLRSDVPIAALLSGGLDSSAVVALMAKELGPGVQTFSVGFGRADDELPFARLVARKWRTDHHEIVVGSDVAEQVAEGLGAFSEPFGDSSAVPTVAVCKEVARHVKVVLTGDGGDELFAGYGRYQVLGRLPHVPGGKFLKEAAERLPLSRWRSRLSRLGRAVAAKGEARNRALLEVFAPSLRAELLGGGGQSSVASIGSLPNDVDSALAFDLGVYLPDDLLLKTDTSSMRWGLEARCPLLDHELAELAVPPPANAKLSAGEGKVLLRQAVGDLLPSEVLRREKRGFGSPVGEWLSGPLRPLIEDLLRPGSARIRNWFDGPAVDRVLDEVTSGRGNGHQGWALLALEAWARTSAGSSRG